MKKLIIAAALVLMPLCAGAQSVYLKTEELPDMVKSLPAPPDTIGTEFDHDVLRYLWGKKMRSNPERLAVAKRDAIWQLDTLAAIFSEPFGMKISPEETPEIYRLFINGVSTIEQIRVAPKRYYNRIRPFVYFHESTIFPEDDAELSVEGSYPSGHAIRGWTAALILSEVNQERANELCKRGWDYGESRVIAGAHWQSDVDMSRLAASMAYASMQTSCQYKKQVKKARAEFLKKAGKDKNNL